MMIIMMTVVMMMMVIRIITTNVMIRRSSREMMMVMIWGIKKDQNSHYRSEISMHSSCECPEENHYYQPNVIFIYIINIRPYRLAVDHFVILY